MICFGVDVGGTSIKMGAFECGGNLLNKWEIPTRKEDHGAYILDDICEAMEDYISKHDIAATDVYGIGIGVPGPVTSEGVVLSCVNLGWGERPVAKQLSKKFHGIPVYVGNDANVAALGEQKCGSAKGYEDMVMVTLGTGVGGGVILGGKIITGCLGAAGEIGHMPVLTDNTEKCSCGKTDCLELAASATGIVREAKKMIAKKQCGTKLSTMEYFSAKTVLDLAQEGDEGAIYVVNRVADILATALACIASVLNPQAFVIGGGVSKAGQWFLDLVKEAYQKKAFTPLRDAEILLALLGNDAGIYGAAEMCNRF